MSIKPHKQRTGLTFELFQSEKLDSEHGNAGHPVPPLETRELGDAVVRRTRSLITLSPILEIERSKTQRELDLSKHDLRLLSLVVLDVVIDKMGFGTGARRHDIALAMAPILRAADPGLAHEAEDQIIDLDGVRVRLATKVLNSGFSTHRRCAPFSAYCRQCSKYADSCLATNSTTLVQSHVGASSLLLRFRFRTIRHFFRTSLSICCA